MGVKAPISTFVSSSIVIPAEKEERLKKLNNKKKIAKAPCENFMGTALIEYIMFGLIRFSAQL
jgi:hypothetical protein